MLSLELPTNRQQDERGRFLCRAMMPVDIHGRRRNTVNDVGRGDRARTWLELFTFQITRGQSTATVVFVTLVSSRVDIHLLVCQENKSPFELLFNSENWVTFFLCFELVELLSAGVSIKWHKTH